MTSIPPECSRLHPQTVPAEYAKAEVSPALKALNGTPWQSVLLIGPAGTGKTSQLWAVVRRSVTGREWEGEQAAHLISECADVDRYRYDWDWLMAWSKFPGVLCVDDLGYRKPHDWTIQAVYQIATYRRAHKLRVIWTTNLDRDRLAESYGGPIASRLTGGVVIDTGGADRRQRK
jgi:DNA replication protein DnaC